MFSLTRQQSMMRRTKLVSFHQPEDTFNDFAADGKMTRTELHEFLGRFALLAFEDHNTHEGWIRYHSERIEAAHFTSEKPYLDSSSFTAVLHHLSTLNLWTNTPRTVTVLGAGAFGAAMAATLGTAGHRVKWLVTSGHKSEAELEAMAEYININHTSNIARTLAQLPPDYKFPSNVVAFHQPAKALEGTEYVVHSLVGQGSFKWFQQNGSLIPPGVPIIITAKSICSSKYIGVKDSHELQAKIANGEVKEPARDPTYMMCQDEAIRLAMEPLNRTPANPLVALAGPSFAKQVCKLEPTAVTIACSDEALAREVALMFSTPKFKCFYTTDIVGAELAGALKNVVALACGMCIGVPAFKIPQGTYDAIASSRAEILEMKTLTEAQRERIMTLLSAKELLHRPMQREYKKKKGGAGLGLGPNCTNFLLTRAWEDVRKICVAKGAKSETLLALSGLGDLLATCYGAESRNAKMGAMLASAAVSGETKGSFESPTMEFILSNPNHYPVAEGYWTSFALNDLAKKLGVDIPVLSKICDVLGQRLDPRDLISTMMTDPIGPEFNSQFKDQNLVVPAQSLTIPTNTRRLLNKVMEHKAHDIEERQL